MTQTLALSSTNLAQGSSIVVDFPELPGNALVLTSAASGTHLLQLVDARSDTGVPLTATATGGAMGVSRTAGTSLTLVGEATSSSAKTDKAIFAFALPATYVAGGNFTIAINASIAGSGTLTGASCTLTPAVYYELVGVETSLTVGAAQQIVTAGSTLTFIVTGTAALTPGTQIIIELVMLITSASGANTGQINSVSYFA